MRCYLADALDAITPRIPIPGIFLYRMCAHVSLRVRESHLRRKERFRTREEMSVATALKKIGDLSGSKIPSQSLPYKLALRVAIKYLRTRLWSEGIGMNAGVESGRPFYSGPHFFSCCSHFFIVLLFFYKGVLFVFF